MTIKHIFFPELIDRIPSDINGDIEVIKFMGELRIDCGGLTQSGGVMEKIWGNAIRKLVPTDFVPKRILMLGVGAGSSLKVLSRKYKTAQILGVEIDPVMIQVARKYFLLDKLRNIDIEVADAISYVQKLPKSEHFDLTLVDCYQGDHIPESFENIEFLKTLKSHTDFLLLNRLFWSDYQKKSLKFLSELQKNFTTTTTRTPSNLVITLK